MTITAKYAATCSACRQSIAPGSKIEWTKGGPVRHAACAGAAVTTARPAARNYDAQKFNGYGAARGGFRRACKTDGNCSSIGSGRNCGGHDCDGF